MARPEASAVNPDDPAFVADPYPTFHALRDQRSLHAHPGWGTRIAVSHEVCSAILRHRGLGRIWSDVEPAREFDSFNALHRLNMLESEEHHDRYRAAFAALFQRRHVDSLRGMITGIVERLFSELREHLDAHGTADFMNLVARPLPVDVITSLLGFPERDRHLLRTWSNRIVKMYEPGVGEAARAAAEQAAREFREYVGELLADLRLNPGDDALSTLGTAVDGGWALSPDELVANYVLLLMAGHEASVNGLGNAVAALHDNPAQWRLLRDRIRGDDTAMATAVDELVRFDTPNQLFERTATRPVELAGERIEEGDVVVVLLGAANRDSAIFPEPDTLDLTRAPNPHLAFGAGVHYCLGAPLARLEIGLALAAMAEQLPHYSLAEVPRRGPAFTIRGFDRLDIAA